MNLISSTSITLWEEQKSLQEIRKLFAPKLSDIEFQFFVGLGKASGLNPFTREIWAVKYDERAAAQVFIGRDGYRKAAQSHPEYDYHQCDAVYENDEFHVNNGEITHKYNLKNRGQLIGAYCIAKRKKSSRPIYVFSELKEYSTGKSLWNSVTGKPATMIKKVAESQCLRAAFQDLLGGTYTEEEIEKTAHIDAGQKSDILLQKIQDAKGDIYATSAQNNELQSKESKLQEIQDLLAIKEFDQEKMQSAMNFYKATSLQDLDYEQCNHFIKCLLKLDDKNAD